MKTVINERIHVSELRASDKVSIVEPLAEKEIYDLTLRIPYPYTEADADKWLAHLADSTRLNGQPATWAIRDTSDLLIGCIGYEQLTVGKSHRAEIGYWLAKPYWGRGIM